jgi:hypothetical protein
MEKQFIFKFWRVENGNGCEKCVYKSKKKGDDVETKSWQFGRVRQAQKFIEDGKYFEYLISEEQLNIHGKIG